MRKTFRTSQPPTARRKLNAADVLGSPVMAGAVGLPARRATIFLLAALALPILSVHSGGIRL